MKKKSKQNKKKHNDQRNFVHSNCHLCKIVHYYVYCPFREYMTFPAITGSMTPDSRLYVKWISAGQLHVKAYWTQKTIIGGKEKPH